MAEIVFKNSIMPPPFFVLSSGKVMRMEKMRWWEKRRENTVLQATLLKLKKLKETFYNIYLRIF